MGCGGSKFDPDGIQIPVRLRPLLHCRIEEIKRRRHSRSLVFDTTPSKKKLLKEDDETVASDHHHQPVEVKSVSSRGDSASCVTSEDSKGKDASTKERKSRKTTREDSEGKDKAQGREKIVVYDNVVKQEVKLVENGEDADDEDEDEDGRMIGHENGDEVFLGSPSFREYLNDNLVDDDDKNIESNPDAGLNHADQSEGIPASKESKTKKVKKGGKRRSFRKVIPKNILNVRSCYSSANSNSSHDRTHLLTEKPAA